MRARDCNTYLDDTVPLPVWVTDCGIRVPVRLAKTIEEFTKTHETHHRLRGDLASRSSD